MKKWKKLLLVVMAVAIIYLVPTLTIQMEIQKMHENFNRAVSSENPILDEQLGEYTGERMEFTTPMDVITNIIGLNNLYFEGCPGTKDPDEFLRTRCGDCTEFACLSSYIFNYFGVPNKACSNDKLMGAGHLYNKVYLNLSIASRCRSARDGIGWYYMEFYSFKELSPGVYFDIDTEPLCDDTSILDTLFFCGYREWTVDAVDHREKEKELYDISINATGSKLTITNEGAYDMQRAFWSPGPTAYYPWERGMISQCGWMDLQVLVNDFFIGVDAGGEAQIKPAARLNGVLVTPREYSFGPGDCLEMEFNDTAELDAGDIIMVRIFIGWEDNELITKEFTKEIK